MEMHSYSFVLWDRALGVGQMASDLTLATLVHKGVHGVQNRHVSTAVLDS